MDLEGAKRVLIERGHENDLRQPRHVERLEDVEAIQLRHLDVEQHQIGRRRLDRVHGRGAVPAFTGDGMSA